MPGYIITNAEVFDKDAYGEYGKLAPDAIAKYGGEFLTRGARPRYSKATGNRIASSW